MNKNHFYIEIDERKIPMAFNKFTMVMYKRYFNRDLFNTMNECVEAGKLKFEIGNLQDGLKQGTYMAQIVWAFAKTANLNIPSFQKWFDEFKEFPVNIIFPQLIAGFLLISAKGVKKNGK